jgi:hypothetical protein
MNSASTWRQAPQGEIVPAGPATAGAEDGSIRNRSGDRYKPSAVCGYEQALRLRLVPELGGVRLGDLRRADVQALVD